MTEIDYVSKYIKDSFYISIPISMDPIFNFQTFTPSAAPTRISCFSGQTNKFALVF